MDRKIKMKQRKREAKMAKKRLVQEKREAKALEPDEMTDKPAETATTTKEDKQEKKRKVVEKTESVEEKTARINRLENDNELESIKLYLMKVACDGQDSKWDPQCAHDHAKKMLKVINWGIMHYWKKYFNE